MTFKGASSSNVASFRGIPLKYIALATLVLQNSMLVLVLRYSRMLPGTAYVEPTAVVMCELLKLVICTVIFWTRDLRDMCETEFCSTLPSYETKNQSMLRSDSANTLADMDEEGSDCQQLKPSRSKFHWKLRRGADIVFGNYFEMLKIATPAILYFVQNNLQYVAASYLDAATFQVTYQMKILTTALCSVAILGRKLSTSKWVSLFVLTLGIALVQMPSGPHSATTEPVSIENAVVTNLKVITDTHSSMPMNHSRILAQQPVPLPSSKSHAKLERRGKDTVTVAAMVTGGSNSNPRIKVTESDLVKGNSKDTIKAAQSAQTTGGTLASPIFDPANADALKDSKKNTRAIGLFAVSLACFLSGLAGVYFEKVLKGSSTSLWARNIQMSVCSLVPGYFIGCLLYEGERIAAHGFFQGYNMWTWICILNQAAGGLLVAVVVKYADNILKGFATSLSIICSSVASMWLFDFHMGSFFILGSSLVIYATFLYGGTNLVALRSSRAKDDNTTHVKL